MIRLRKFAIVGAFAALTIMSGAARAEFESKQGTFLLSLGGLAKTDARSRTAKSDTLAYLAEARMGYAVVDTLFIGALFGLEADSVKMTGYTDSSQNGTTDYKRQSYGPSLGWVSEHFFLFCTYHLQSTWTLESKPTSGVPAKDTYTGQGVQVDLGVAFEIGPVLIGPQLSFRSFTYTKLKTLAADEAILNPTLINNKIEPQISLWMTF